MIIIYIIYIHIEILTYIVSITRHISYIDSI